MDNSHSGLKSFNTDEYLFQFSVSLNTFDQSQTICS